MKRYDLIIVTAEPFPYGQAATNRILSYAKGLAEEKKVLYICYAGPAIGKSDNKEKEGTYKNIDFKYLGRPYSEKNISAIERALLLLFRYIKLAYLLLFAYKYKSILLYSRAEFISRYLQFIRKIKRANLYRDVTEATGYAKTAESTEKLKQDTAKYDGVIVISTGIRDFFDNISDEKRYLLPVLVDMERFDIERNTSEKYFFCCSGANLERDGLLDCIKAFLKFHESHPDYKFKIASLLNLKDPYHQKVKKLIDENPQSIEWMGAIPSFRIPQLMKNATALMLTPHKNYETKGFPTKLGEYLASATPTICSTIDDLTEVIDDSVAYMVNPNSPHEIAAKMEHIINNRSDAAQIGEKGKEMMKRLFTYTSYSDTLIKFLKL